MKKNRSILMLALLMTLAGCGSTPTSDSTTIPPTSDTSTEGSNSTSQPTTGPTTEAPHIPVESIDIDENPTTINVQETLQLLYKVLPENATEKSVTFQSSQPDILSVDSTGLVTGLKAGTSTVTITAKDNNKTASLELTVIDNTPLPGDAYDPIFTLLDTAKSHELTASVSGTIQEDLLGSLDDTFTVYQNGIQTENDAEKTITWQEENQVRTLRVRDTVTLSKESIGENGLAQEEAEEKTSLYQGLGLAMKIKEEILEHSSRLGNAEEKENATVQMTDTESGKRIEILSKAETEIFFSKVYLDQSLTFLLDKEGKLMEYSYLQNSYDKETYDFESHQFKVENPTPETTAFSKGSLTYGTRVESDSNRLMEADYKIQSFDLEIQGTPSALEVGESYTLQVKNVLPSLHIEESYKITNISDPTIIAKNNYNDMRFQVLKAGDCSLTVQSDSGIEKTISLHCVAPEVDSIDFDWFMEDEVEVGQTIDVLVDVSPEGAVDRSYRLDLNDGEEQFAQIITNDDGSYSLKGIKAGTVHLTATANANESLTATKEITITEPLTLAIIEAELTAKDYTYRSNRMHLSSDKTGTLVLEGGGEYSFQWEASLDLMLSFKNVTALVEPEKWYDFTGRKPARISSDFSSLTVSIYDMDYSEETIFTFTKEA